MACSVRRRWCVEDDDVRVEFGCIMFRETRSDAFAFRIAELHSSRSASLAEDQGSSRYCNDWRMQEADIPA